LSSDALLCTLDIYDVTGAVLVRQNGGTPDARQRVASLITTRRSELRAGLRPAGERQPARRLAVWTAEMVLVCALSLLHRSVGSFPPIEFVAARPAYVSANADAYVPLDHARIYLITTSPAFTRARRAAYKCGEVNALRKIASVLVHEEWHVRHGSDEAGAYAAQLSTLISLDAGPGNPLYYEVTRSMQVTIRRLRETARLSRR
jgi:hypothetical protein